MKIAPILNIRSSKNNFKQNHNQIVQNNTSSKTINAQFLENNYGRAQVLFGSNYSIDDIEIDTIAKNLGIERTQAARYYDGYIKKYAKSNVGLAAIKGFSREKYKLAMEMVRAIAEVQKTGNKYADRSFIPCGVLLYGPSSSGKIYISDKLCEGLEFVGANIRNVSFSEGDDKTQVIFDAFSQAQKDFIETNKFSIINFRDSLDSLDESEIDALMECAADCSSSGVVWISSISDAQSLNPGLFSDRIATIIQPVMLEKESDYSEIILHLLEKYNTKQKSLHVFNVDEVVKAIKDKGYNLTMGEISEIARKTVEFNSRSNRLADTESFIDQIEEFFDNETCLLNEEGVRHFEDDIAYMNYAKENNY